MADFGEGEIVVASETAVRDAFGPDVVVAPDAMRCPACRQPVANVRAELTLAETTRALLGEVRLSQTRPARVELRPCGCRFENVPGGGLRPISDPDPALPAGTVELRDRDTGRVLGRIENIGEGPGS